MTAGREAAIRYERDYIERTIATVRNHRGADNCWPQWANIFADEIEACWAELAAARERERVLREDARAFGQMVLDCDRYGCENGPYNCLHGQASRFLAALDAAGEQT